jgi:periplasmic copper chaperone A
MKKTPTLLALAGTLLISTATLAQTTVKEAWVRGTIAQQKATGMFAQITSTSGGKLVSATSPAAGVVEIHEMSMEGNVMKMRALPNGLDLPAGKTVELKPGGYHVMLMDLKKPMNPGETVAVSLVIEGKDGKKETVEIQAPIKPLSAMTPAKKDEHSAHKH